MSKITVEICTGTTCYVLGSVSPADVYARLPGELVGQVDVNTVSCLKACCNKNDGQAPFVRVGTRVIGNADVENIVEAVFNALQQETRQ